MGIKIQRPNKVFALRFSSLLCERQIYFIEGPTWKTVRSSKRFFVVFGRSRCQEGINSLEGRL